MTKKTTKTRTYRVETRCPACGRRSSWTASVRPPAGATCTGFVAPDAPSCGAELEIAVVTKYRLTKAA